MEISTFEDIYLKLSLYKPFKLNEEYGEYIAKIFSYRDNLQFDCYCPECSKESTFVMDKNDYYIKVAPLATRNDTIPYLLDRLHGFRFPRTQTFRCQRNNHVFTYNFYFKDDHLIKTGQYPSMADIEIPGIQKYRNLLKRDYSDFSKAIGLHSHGVGAGSFVYLRRIFENLIEEIHQEYLQSDQWDDDLYKRSRMDDKIKLLQDKLPEVLVENRAVYGIMSKGIHELSEKECLNLFPDVKLGIELILDEKLYEQEKQSKKRSFSSFISKTAAELK
ncbi:hypothetical protein ACIQGW_05190 [Lysinibacillus xylanilyticus]|uniref:hypothetical protein n=1 Tax=Lysinibacillus xylanilyticus TaxID=582475 RepID=UPI0037F249E0